MKIIKYKNFNCVLDGMLGKLLTGLEMECKFLAGGRETCLIHDKVMWVIADFGDFSCKIENGEEKEFKLERESIGVEVPPNQRCLIKTSFGVSMNVFIETQKN